jgi:DNA-binding transcriptional LysR family regulator
MPSLDQLHVLLAVVDSGSFAAAARRLHRATSAISYQIDHLEEQLGIALFDRAGTRKPVLTEAGRALLADVRTVSRDIERLRARVRSLSSGLESEVSLAVDVMLPTSRLVDAAQAFQRSFPSVPLRLHVEALGAVTQRVLEGTACLGISGPLDIDTGLTEQIDAGDVELVVVAASSHPLARLGIIEPGAARDHVQLVLTDRSPLTAGRDFGVLGRTTWRIADLGAKHALLLAGIGWGGMPREMVQADLDAGRLVPLALPESSSHGLRYRLHLVHRTDTPPGPATAWLIARFRQQAASGG